MSNSSTDMLNLAKEFFGDKEAFNDDINLPSISHLKNNGNIYTLNTRTLAELSQRQLSLNNLVNQHQNNITREYEILRRRQQDLEIQQRKLYMERESLEREKSKLNIARTQVHNEQQRLNILSNNF
jgi:hypothetical protein